MNCRKEDFGVAAEMKTNAFCRQMLTVGTIWKGDWADTYREIQKHPLFEFNQ